mmetsp:Transcript_14927/g.40013  ORF Transcript_14927/g.40013 Transcript_14927/m.40013 type:complete len:97 (-) Transcript_14927:780-1070(-)
MPVVELTFGGGLELLVGGQKKLSVDVPGESVSVGMLIDWIRRNLITERHELFVQGDSIRPGVLVLINDSDWELEGTTAYDVASGDQICFISTLHGG